MNIEIQKAVDLLKAGKIVAIPTETVYGLAANALDSEAVAKIFEVKNRPHFDPLIVHIPQINDVKKWVIEFPENAQLLAEKFWPGPLTLLLPKNDLIPDIVTAGLQNVALRVPKHDITLELLKALKLPLAAPSANPFGYVSPTNATHVAQQLGNKIDYILDGGNCEVGIESTVVGFENNQPVIFRLGGISIEEIEAITGEVKMNLIQNSNPKAPGMLTTHYAPNKKIIFKDWGEILANYCSDDLGIISLKDYYEGFNPEQHYLLSKEGNLKEAASNLFSTLRKIEKNNYKFILAEEMPEEGLGRAINDRLKRASINNI
jgi:L-threonylcarbamoyladenylate synthase